MNVRSLWAAPAAVVAALLAAVPASAQSMATTAPPDNGSLIWVWVWILVVGVILIVGGACVGGINR